MSRGSKQIIAAIMVVLLAAVAGAAFIAFRDRDDDTPQLTSVRVHSTSGLSVVRPQGWKSANNATGVFVWFGDSFIHEDCARRDMTQLAVFLEVAGTSDKGVTIPRRHGTYGARPAHFTELSGGGVQTGFADQNCDSSSQQILFIEKGRYVAANLTFGKKTSKKDRAKTYEILDSLRVAAPPGSQ